MTEHTENIMGYPVSFLDRDECIRTIYSWIRSGSRQKYFVCANPHSFEIAETDPEFQKAILHADLITPDGSGIVLASKILKGRIHKRVTGSGVFRELSRKLNEEGGHRVFFLGSSEENLERIREKMKKDFPGITVCGTYSPPFTSVFSEKDNRLMIDAVNHASPDVLWVGMTAPKQEKWVYRNKDRLNVSFIGPVGAVFDFYTETVKRANPVFFRFGLEWLPRLLQQPGRLWRRMGVSAPGFLMKILKQKMRQ